MPDCRCEVWPDAEGPCGAPVVERMRYVNEWMDHPGPDLGLGLCEAHLAEYLEDQMMVNGDRLRLSASAK